MKIIGVTGSFGSGKTFVSSCFAKLGAKVIDADKVARSVFKKGSVLNREIASAFGPRVVKPDGNIDRKALAKIVFSDKSSLNALNRMAHPGIIKRIKEIARRSGKKRTIVIDAPLLFEAKLDLFCDHTVVVKASLEKQVERCRKKFRMKRREVLERIRNQMPMARKLRRAGFVVDNRGTMAETEKQVGEIWRKAWR